MVEGEGLANLIEFDPYLTWEVPKSWSLIDAATVPCIYATTLIALLKVNISFWRCAIFRS